ncbi:Coagulation factor V, partial [Acropora cervicornis]
RSSRDTREFFRLDMQKVYAVSRIVFLGGMHNNGKCHRKESDRSIELRYSLDDVIWGLYGTYGFRPGLTIYYEEEYQCIGILDIMPTIFAKILNIYELGRGGHNCCDAPLGMESKRIKDSQLKVSSFNPSGLTMRASRARLHVFGGWCTKSIENSEWSGRKYFVPKEYLEIDLLTEKFIDGFATQGHADINNPRWVTGYVVHYSDSVQDKLEKKLLEIPQIIVQQRVDPTIDGGMPLWGKPAVVYASGPVASIGVMILGIRDYLFLEPRSFLPDRLWTLYYLGFTQRDPDYDSAYRKCAKLAQAKGYDHLLLWSDHCFSSYSMPANLQIKYRPEKRLRTWPEESYRTFSLPYFIKGLIKDTQRQTSLLYALETYSDDDLFKFFRSRGRFRAYDKAYYGDYFAPLHVLEIDKMELQDLGTYKVTVKHLKSGAWSEKMIELRHEEEPRISLPETFGACLHTPTEMQLTLQDDNFRDPNKWSITWYHVKESRRAPRTRTLLSKGTTTLRVERPTLKMSGDAFEVDVKNQYGFARGISRISPHLAAKDFSDTLEVKIDNDKTLTKVNWYHNGTLIERNAEGFAFPGEKHGALSLRKKLKLTRMSFTAGGTYRVVAVGKYCQFEKTIQVQVVINPRLVVNPHAVYMRVYEGFAEIKMDVTVKGGVPKPEVSIV